MASVNYTALHQARLEQNITVEELAFLANLNHSLVSRYDWGKIKRPTVKTLCALEDALGLKRGTLIEE